MAYVKIYENSLTGLDSFDQPLVFIPFHLTYLDVSINKLQG